MYNIIILNNLHTLKYWTKSVNETQLGAYIHMLQQNVITPKLLKGVYLTLPYNCLIL